METVGSGKVVSDRLALWGTIVEGLTWNFENGKMISYSATSNQEVFDEFYGGASGDKDKIAHITIGVNPAGVPTGLGLTDAICAGVVSIGIGRNIESGGKNETNFSWSISLTDASLVADGVTLVENGKLKV